MHDGRREEKAPDNRSILGFFGGVRNVGRAKGFPPKLVHKAVLGETFFLILYRNVMTRGEKRRSKWYQKSAGCDFLFLLVFLFSSGRCNSSIFFLLFSSS